MGQRLQGRVEGRGPYQFAGDIDTVLRPKSCFWGGKRLVFGSRANRSVGTATFKKCADSCCVTNRAILFGPWTRPRSHSSSRPRQFSIGRGPVIPERRGGLPARARHNGCRSARANSPRFTRSFEADRIGAVAVLVTEAEEQLATPACGRAVEIALVVTIQEADGQTTAPGESGGRMFGRSIRRHHLRRAGGR